LKKGRENKHTDRMYVHCSVSFVELKLIHLNFYGQQSMFAFISSFVML